MKEINIKLYSFEELSKDAKAMICNKERESVYNYGTMAMESDSDERVATLNAFCKLFGITYRIDYDHSRRFISWQFQNVEMNGYEWNDEDISGKYLLRFLNRYYYDIRQRKYQYKSKSGKIRKSKIGWYVGGCPLTGMCYDEDILEKIFDWYENPDYNITLHDLFEDCFSYYMNLWEEEDDYRMSDEYIGEIIAINNEDALYFADGTEFPGSIDELESYAA